MPAYLITYRETPVSDPVAIAEYSRRNRENAVEFQSRFGLRAIVIYGRSEAAEGANPDGIVVLKFPTYDDAWAWYRSPAYQAAIPFRQKAAEWRVVIVEGLD